MKKTILSLLMLICATVANANDYNASQETLRKDISTFLQHKGYKPENQDDGLKFKSEGFIYFIEISDSNTDPMYLRLCMYLNYGKNLTREKALQNLNDYNVRFGVKTTCLEKYLLISAEMFVGKSSEFTDVFDELLSQVKGTYDLIN